jgi:hypothetical protein
VGLYVMISTKLKNRKTLQYDSMVLLSPVWYQGVITIDEVQVTLTI